MHVLLVSSVLAVLAVLLAHHMSVAKQMSNVTQVSQLLPGL
jgi:hypothetical protein